MYFRIAGETYPNPNRVENEFNSETGKFVARTATEDSPVFSILAAADSGIENVEDLAGVEIGISEATVIEYMTDRVLENAGLAPEEIVKVAVPRIPDRLALLQSGSGDDYKEDLKLKLSRLQATG